MRQALRILILLAASATVMSACDLLPENWEWATVSGHVTSSLAIVVRPTIKVSGADEAGWADLTGLDREKGYYEIRWIEPGTHTITLTYSGPQGHSATCYNGATHEHVPVTAVRGQEYFDPLRDAYYNEWTITIEGVSIKENTEIDFFLGYAG